MVEIQQQTIWAGVIGIVLGAALMTGLSYSGLIQLSFTGDETIIENPGVQVNYIFEENITVKYYSNEQELLYSSIFHPVFFQVNLIDTNNITNQNLKTRVVHPEVESYFVNKAVGMRYDTVIDNSSYWIVNRTISQFYKTNSPVSMVVLSILAYNDSGDIIQFERLDDGAFINFQANSTFDMVFNYIEVNNTDNIYMGSRIFYKISNIVYSSESQAIKKVFVANNAMNRYNFTDITGTIADLKYMDNRTFNLTAVPQGTMWFDFPLDTVVDYAEQIVSITLKFWMKCNDTGLIFDVGYVGQQYSGTYVSLANFTTGTTDWKEYTVNVPITPITICNFNLCDEIFMKFPNEYSGVKNYSLSFNQMYESVQFTTTYLFEDPIYV